MARIPFESGNEVDSAASVQIARGAVWASNMEDIIFSTLAPILRRRGLIMIHAFAAVSKSEALLVVGRSGSGKTTTGLGLIAHGWHYLANDVALVNIEGRAVFALPTPGGIGLDHNSFELLPELPHVAVGMEYGGKMYFPARTLVGGWAGPAPITRILFPRIDEAGENELRRVTQSVTLARLLEASVDRWDRPSLDDHVRILEQLSKQAMGFDLRLNRDLGTLPSLLG